MRNWLPRPILCCTLTNEYMNDDFNTEKFLTPKDLAEKFSISESSVYRLIDKRKFASYKIGGSLRLRQSDIYEFMESARIKPIV